MDQLTAYQVLELEPGSSIEEIKAAYARLSKEFHPEEHPEEFQRIHEAYSMLVRGARRGRQERVPNEYHRPEQPPRAEFSEQKEQPSYHFDWIPNQTDIPEQKEQEQWEERPSYHFEQIPGQTAGTEQKRQSEQPEYRFDQALERAKEQEQNNMHQLTMQALAEMEILLSPQYRNKLKLFRSFFQKENYQSVLKEPEFMHHFSRMLAGTKLKKPVYDYFIDYYRFRGLNFNELIPEAAELYRVLDMKRGMHAKARNNVSYAVPAGILAGLRAGIRSGTEMTAKVFWVLFACVVIATLMIWIYRKLYENHSSIFSQSMIAIFLMVSHLIILFTDFYEPLFGEDAGILLAFFGFVAAGIWLFILGIAAVISKLCNRRCV